MALLLAKGAELNDWRGLDEFVASYRGDSIKLASAVYPAEITTALGTIRDRLGDQCAANRQLIDRVGAIADTIAAADDQEGLRRVLSAFYQQAYAHFSQFGSAPAFFEAANTFLRCLTSRQVAGVRQQLPTELPPLALLVLGPAGRLETTRFCRIQLALVWDGDGSAGEEQLMEEFAEELLAWLRTSGVALEEAVTPLHRFWRGTLEQWRVRLEDAVEEDDAPVLIELLRLTDQAVLVDEQGIADRFRALCCEQLHQRPAVANLVERCSALSNGLGMMGGLRLHRSGPHRGTFSLLDHALVPLAACTGALCLFHDIVEDGTPGRLRELVRNGRLDVNLAERALQAWHLFSTFRLGLEQQAGAGQDCRDILNLNVAALAEQEQSQLRSALEVVADLQRHLIVSFGQQP